MRNFAISNWSFNVKFLLTPLVAVGLLVVVAFAGVNALQSQQKYMENIVLVDLQMTTQLYAAVLELERVNTSVYKALTNVAAGNEDVDLAALSKDSEEHIDRIIHKLSEYSLALDRDAEKEKFETSISKLEEYKGAINWIISMLELDFESAVSFIKPFQTHVGNIVDIVNLEVAKINAA